MSTVQLDAEEALLGALLQGEAATWDEVADLWVVGMFTDPARETLGAIIAELYRARKPVDLVTVVALLGARGLLEEAVPRELPFRIVRGVGVTSNARYYAGIVREAWGAREARRVLAEALNDTTSKPEVLVAGVQKRLAQIEFGRSRAVLSLGEALAQFMDELNAEAAKRPGTAIASTGFPAVDAITGGFEVGLPHLYAARPGVGKSAFAVGLIRKAAGEMNEPVGVFWLEDTVRKLCLRIAAAEATIPAVLLRHGSLMPQDAWARLVNSQERLTRWPLYIESAKGMKATEIAQRMRRLYRERGVRRFLVDHLGELKMERDDDRKDEALGDALRLYRDTLDELGAGGAIFHQLGRKAEQGGTPNLSWLFNSDVVGQVARVVGFIDRKDREVSVYYAKATYGPSGVQADLAWDPVTMAIFQPQPLL